MPTYDFKCNHCGNVQEAVAGMSERWRQCPECGGAAQRQFSANRNILVPERFRLDAGWNNSGNSTGEPWSRNSTVHAPKRTTYTEEFDKAWEKAGRP